MDSSEARILLLVGHALYEPWKSILYKGQLETWAKGQEFQIKHCHALTVSPLLRKIDSWFWNLKWNESFGKIAIIIEMFIKDPLKIFQGNLKESNLVNSNHESLVLRMPDLDFLMNFKSFAIITGTLKFDYDFVVITTTSSYLNLELLKKEISRLPKKNVVAGRILEQNGVKFASGSFRVFSRDVVEKMLIDKKHYSKWRADDLAYGFLLNRKDPHIKYLSLPSIDADTVDKINSLSQVDLESVVHFRLKSGTHEKRNDIELMHLLHRRLES